MFVIFPSSFICLFSCFVESWFIVVSLGSRMFDRSNRVKIPRRVKVKESFNREGFMITRDGKDLLIILCLVGYGKIE